MTNLDSIFKSRDITLPTKVRVVKAIVFPVVMYGCDSWSIKKAKCQRIDAFVFFFFFSNFILLGSKITVDGDFSHEIKRHLFLGKKVITNLDSILKSRDIANKATVFPVVMYGCDSWTIKKAEH